MINILAARNFIIWCLAIFGNTINAQATQDTLYISGRVHDMTNDPIIGASVEIPLLKCNTETSIEGEFSFNLFGEFSELSEFLIEVRLTGYIPKDTVFNLKNKFDDYSTRKFFIELQLEYPMPGPTIVPDIKGYYPSSFIVSTYKILDSISGDLNNDEFSDLAFVLANVADTTSEIFDRRILLLRGMGNGLYNILGKNDKILACRVCGGNVDDPYMGIEINNGSLTINQHAGSAWLTTWSYTFTFDPSDQELKLRKEIFNTFHSTEFQKENVTENTKQYGISFDAWKPDE